MATNGTGDTKDRNAGSAKPRRATHHKVVKGDTLTGIAKKYGVSVSDVAKWSGLGNVNKLLPVGALLAVSTPYPGSLNNPGNITYSKAVTYKGQTGKVKGEKSGNWFRTFDTAQNGLNAMGSSIGQMVRRKIPRYFREKKIPDDRFNIHNLISVYAPEEDGNDTAGYIRYVSKRLRLDPKADLDIWDTGTMAKILNSMIRRDTGHEHADWFTPEEYEDAAKNMTVVGENETGEQRHDRLVRMNLNGNLSPFGRKPYLFREEGTGKVYEYGTQRSIVVRDGGSYVAIPTIVDGNAPMSDADAEANYRKTGKFFHRGRSREEALAAAEAAHYKSADEGMAWWNNYIADHLNDGTLSAELQKAKDDPGFMKWARGEEPGVFKRVLRQDAKGGKTSGSTVPLAGMVNGVPLTVSAPLTGKRKKEYEAVLRRRRDEQDRRYIGAYDGRYTPARPVTLPEALVSRLPTGASRDMARMALHGLARTGNTILKAIDIPNRVFGNTRSLLQDIYEKSEENLARDAYEDQSGVPQFGETAVHLASAGVLGKALPAVFGANVGADTYETAKYAGASEGEALAKGVGHGVVDTAIWTLGQGLASKYLPKAWQWLGREITGAGRGAASSVTSDAVLNSLGADISAEDMAKRAAHAAWMVPLLGMLKMGGKRREEAMSLLGKARPDLAGEKADKVIETIEAEFSDPKSQKVALAWVARKGANLPDDTAQIKQALEVSSKVKGLDPMSRSPFEILSDPAYARYLPKPKPQDVKAFTNMKRYPKGVIGFDVSDDAAGRQATREMINAYMSPSSNPWCLATGKGAGKLGELGPGAEGYWEKHSAVPKQIFFQEVDGKLELTAFRATGPGGEGRQEYWDTSDAGYSGIPLKVKVPGDPMGRYQKMVFRPETEKTTLPETIRAEDHYGQMREMTRQEAARELSILEDMAAGYEANTETQRRLSALNAALEPPVPTLAEQGSDVVQGTFEDIAPGKVFKGDPFRDGRSQTWSLVKQEQPLDPWLPWVTPRLSGETPQYALIEDKVRTTQNGITKFRTTKYADPTDYEPPKPGEQPKPVEIEESELVDPGWMRARGYDPDNEADVRRMQQEVDVQAWGNGADAAMAVVPTKRTYMRTQSGTPETVTYDPTGRDVVSVDFMKDGIPHREEFFHVTDPVSGLPAPTHPFVVGSVGPELIPRSELGADNIINLAGDGYRLTQHPETADSKVLDELRWDEGIGGLVRTSGNRRWRMGPSVGPEALDPDTRRRIQTVEDGLAERLERFGDWGGMSEIESMGPIIVDGREALSGRRAALAVSWASRGRASFNNDYYPLYSGLRTEAPHWLNADGGWPSADELNELVHGPQVIIEDRQPDGTWAPAMDRLVNPDTGEQVELPPVPPERPVMDAKGGEARADAKGGEARAGSGGGDAAIPQGNPATLDGYGGPRIVINPTTFKNKKDALCVAFNEAFRILMEDSGFEPVSEPTEAQRKFFSDTAYANDEVQLRRTILARICTFDTSVRDPTQEQLEEAVEFLETVMESGAPRNEWEQSTVQRIHDVLVQSAGAKPDAD